jgi:hypothetical protein
LSRLVLVVLLFAANASTCLAQTSSAQLPQLPALLARVACEDKADSGSRICRAALPSSIDTKRNKVGDHIFLKVPLGMDPRQFIAQLDAEIVAIEPAKNGPSSVRIRIQNALDKDGHELPLHVDVLALVARSSVTEGWSFPAIIFDRFPRIPEDDERLPGERKLSEDQPHTSPLDAMPDVPQHYAVICNTKKKNSPGAPCFNLLDARGVLGYKGVTLEPPDPAFPSDSVFSSGKNIHVPAETFLILKFKTGQAIPPSQP